MQGFVRLWERICKGFVRIHDTLGEDENSWRIREDL